MKKFPPQKKLEEVRNRLSKGMASRPLPKDAPAIDRIKFHLCEQFVICKNTQGITQRELALRIGIDEALMSKILHYHFEEFTVDRLIKYLSEIYPDVDVRVDVA